MTLNVTLAKVEGGFVTERKRISINPEDPCRSSDGSHYETCWSCGHDVQDCMCGLDEDEDDGSLDEFGG